MDELTEVNPIPAFILSSSFMPDEPRQDTLHLINGHIDILNDTAVERTSWNMPITVFLLKVAETPKDDAC
jgi:hypothetical protein